jgi:glycosyltransferase involved in cell wall biosynthesis
MLVGKSIAFYLGDERGYRAVTAVVVGTDTLAAQLRSHGIPALTCPPPARGFTVIDGAPPGDAGPLPRALRLLVCAGDLSHPRKNLVDAVRAAELLAARGVRVEVRAIGRNPALLERVASSISPPVELTMLGPRTPTEVHSEMRQADVLLVPSLYEEWGYVAVESILSGTPVVTYPVYPFCDMLSGGIGEIAHAVTVEALADAVERAASGVRGCALARQGSRRFGSTEIGERLSAIWRADVHTARM